MEPYYFGNLDPDLYLSEKPDQNSKAVEDQNGAMEGCGFASLRCGFGPALK
jgi:hypothetical protein